MFNLALSLISSLQAGARIKQSFERSLRQAVNAAIAAVVLIAAAAFGLIAAYRSSRSTASRKLEPRRSSPACSRCSGS